MSAIHGMWHLLFVVLLGCSGGGPPAVANGFGMNLMKVTEEDRSQIVCTVGLLRKYFLSGETLSGSLLSVAVTSASVSVQQSLMRAIHLSDAAWTIVVRHGQQELGGSGAARGLVMHEKPQCYFVVIENLEDDDLEFIFEDWKTTVNWNPLAQFVVLLATVEETDEEMTELMIEILLSFLNRKIYNVNVIGQNEETGYFYGKTVFPYHPDNNCGNRVISIETLDICEYQDGRAAATDDEEYDENEDYDEEVDDEDDDNANADDDEQAGDGEAADNDGVAEESDNQAYGDSEEKVVDSKEIVGRKLNETYEKDESEDGEDGANEQQSSTEAGSAVVVEDTYEVNEEENDVGGNHESADEANLVNARTDIVGQHSGQEKEYKYTKENQIKFLYKANAANNNEHIISMKKTLRRAGGEHQTRFDGILSAYGKPKLSNKSEKEMALDEDVEHDYSFDAGDRVSSEFEGGTSGEPPAEAAKVDEGSSVQVASNERHGDAANTTSNDTSEVVGASNEGEEPDGSAEEEDKPREVKVFMEELYRALFLDKFPQDLSGCPLVAAFRPWEPYVFNEAANKDYTEESDDFAQSEEESADEATYSTETGGNNYDSYDTDSNYGSEMKDETLKLNGIEYKMVQTIGERLHISIEMHVENTNLYHLFQLLIDGDIEMIVGGIDEDPSISQYVSSTIPYHQDDLTWCVAKAKRKHSLFNFLETFKVGAWALTILFILSTAFNVLLIQRLLRVQLWYVQSFATMSLRVMGIVLSQSMRLRKVPVALNITLATAFFMGLMFSNVYQSFLVSTLTTPHSSGQISHMSEIYQHRMSIMGSVDNVRHLNKNSKIFKYIRENFQMCYNIEACLQQAALDERIAVAVSRQHSFYNPRIPRDQLYCFDRDENLYVYLVTMLLPKKYHLLHKINPVIQHIIESGHMQKWARDLDMKRKIHDEIHRQRDDPFKPLTLAQVVGSFVFSSILLSAATVVFLLESWSYRMVTKRRTRLKIPRRLHVMFNRY